jgi:hypothetical protein
MSSRTPIRDLVFQEIPSALPYRRCPFVLAKRSKNHGPQQSFPPIRCTDDSAGAARLAAGIHRQIQIRMKRSLQVPSGRKKHLSKPAYARLVNSARKRATKKSSEGNRIATNVSQAANRLIEKDSFQILNNFLIRANFSFYIARPRSANPIQAGFPAKKVVFQEDRTCGAKNVRKI